MMKNSSLSKCILGVGIMLILILVCTITSFAAEFYIEETFDEINNWQRTGTSVSATNGFATIDTASSTATSMQKTFSGIPSSYVAEFKTRLENASGSNKFVVQVYTGTQRFSMIIYQGNTSISGTTISPQVTNTLNTWYTWRAEVKDGYVILFRGDGDGNNMVRITPNPMSLQTSSVSASVTIYCEGAAGIKASIDYFSVYSLDLYSDEFNTLTGYTITGSTASSDQGNLYLETTSANVVSVKKTDAQIHEKYSFEFKLKVEQFGNGDLGPLVMVYDGNTRLYLGIHRDRLTYIMSGGITKYHQCFNDNEWHTWRVEANSGHVYIYKGNADGTNMKGLVDFDMQSKTDADNISFVAEKAQGIIARFEYAKLRRIPNYYSLPIVPMPEYSPDYTTIKSVSIMTDSAYAYVDRIRTPMDASDTTVKPVIQNGQVLIPAEFICSALGAQLVYDSQNGTIDITLGANTVSMTINSTQYYVNTSPKQLQVTPQIINNKVFVPLTPVSEGLGQNVYPLLENYFNDTSGWTLTGTNITANSGIITIETTASTVTSLKKDYNDVVKNYVAEFRTRLENASGTNKFVVQICTGKERFSMMIYQGNTSISGITISPQITNTLNTWYTWRAEISNGYVILFRGDGDGNNMVRVTPDPIALQARNENSYVNIYCEGATGIKASIDYLNILPFGKHIIVSEGYQSYNEYLDDIYLSISSQQRTKLDNAEQLGLISIKPIMLPEGDNVINDNKHFGWPVAAMANDNIVVYSRRRPTHDGQQNSSSGVFYLRSTDRGDTWGSMVYAEPLFSGGGTDPGAMSCIGVNSQNELIMKGKGVLRSTNGGSTWVLYPDVFSGLSGSGNMGPNMFSHPNFGMMMFTSGGNILASSNGWQQWVRKSTSMQLYNSSLISDPAEPASVTWEGNILLLSREFNEEIGNTGNGTYAMTQHLYRYNNGDTLDDIEFETRQTNIVSAPSTPWANDTADLCYNPYTGRIEALQSARRSEGPTNFTISGDGSASLNLWSISPTDLLNGSSNWTFEGTIFARYKDGDYQLDGLHPGGTVIDPINNVQHIFIYAGRGMSERCGLFQITRTLDTNSLSQFLTQ